jgi:hydrogenase nickel incorporation protein HypB
MTELRQVRVQEQLLKVNDFLARQLKDSWTAQGSFVINLLSSPGSGKTSLLEATLPRLQAVHQVLVLEGDIETDLDARRIRGAGGQALQLTTGGTCHLEAHMLQQAWELLLKERGGPPAFDFVFIENIGNLVCPASYDLGEHLRVVLLSVPEGEDKPPKYPKAFHSADVVLITKVDVLPHFDFRVEEATRLARELNPRVEVLQLSARTGQGLDAWIDQLVSRREATLGRR